MDDYLEWWFECQSDQGGSFARFLRALKPNSAHRGVHDVWEEDFGIRIDYDQGMVTFTMWSGDDEEGFTTSTDEARKVLLHAQDARMGR